LIALSLVLGSLAWTPQPNLGGGEDDREFAERDEGGFRPPRLPVSARSARTWIKLHETMVKPLPDETPFGEAIQALREATRGRDGKEPPIDFFFDLDGLSQVDMTVSSPVNPPILGREAVSLDTYLSLMLDDLDLVHRVDEGVVIIQAPCEDCPCHRTVTAPEARTWLLLHEVVPLKFGPGGEATWPDGLEAIRRATAGKDGRGLLIHVAPMRFKGEVNITSVIPESIVLEQAPLCTSLGLLLGPFGMGFHVREDGVVFVSGELERSSPRDADEVSRRYLRARYDLHRERRKSALPGGEERRHEKSAGDIPPNSPRNPRSETGPGEGARRTGEMDEKK
jgi:hypothetical protein